MDKQLSVRQLMTTFDLGFQEVAEYFALYGTPVESPDTFVSAARFNEVHRLLENDHSNPALRTIFSYGREWGLDPDLLAIAAQTSGCWWVKSKTSQLKRTEAEKVVEWLRSAGLVACVSDSCESLNSDLHLSWTIPVPQCPHLVADVLRIQKLIDENLARLDGLKWKWIVGAVLELLYESHASMRVVKKRGVSLQALEQAIDTHPRLRAKRASDTSFDTVVVRELKRLHRGRLAWLWVKKHDNGVLYLVDQSRQATHRSAPERKAAEFAPGEIVWVALEENKNGRRSHKRHPALLLSLTGKRNDKWLLVSLTSDVDENQEMRRVQDPEALGLPYGGYVWHETQKVYHTQIESHVGWVTRSLIEVVNRTLNLRQTMCADLARIADLHHRDTEAA